MRTTKRFFDLEEVRSLPIKEVCAAFGIRVERSDFIKLRPEEKTASTKLYLNKGTGYDRFYDFGSHIGGDCIQLIEQYHQCSWQDALEDVADAFGIQPVNNFEYEQRGVLTDRQWLKLGVYGDSVSKNLDFDMERFSVESAAKYAEKYRMPVNILRAENPKFYIAAILRNRAFPHVYNLRNCYYMHIYSEQDLQKHVAGCVDRKFLSDERKKEFETLVHELESAEKLLKLALRGTDVRFTFRGYNLEKDWDDILHGKISFEIGSENNFDIKKHAQKHGCELLYATISENDYFKLAPSEPEMPHAAFLRGDTVKLVYTSDRADQVEKMFCLRKEPTPQELDGGNKVQSLDTKIAEAQEKKSDVSAEDKNTMPQR